MTLCEKATEDLPVALSKFQAKLNTERFRSVEFVKTFNVVKELDFCEPKAFPLLFTFKINDLKEQAEHEEEIINEFRSGKFDPVNLVAQDKMRRALDQKKRANK